LAKSLAPTVRKLMKQQMGEQNFRTLAKQYNQTAPLARATMKRATKARSVSTTKGETVSHSELIGTVNGSVGYGVQYAVALNPGLAASFPWLAAQAAKWQQYRFKRLRFEFLTRSPTTKVGSLILVPEYNAATSPPADEKSAASMQGAMEGTSWANLDCKFDSASMNSMGTRHYVRATNVAGDIKTYDSGTFYLATLEQDNTDAIGKLWVHYEVELFNPITSNPILAPKCFAQWYASGNQALANDVGVVLGNGLFDTELTNTTGATAAVTGFTIPSGVYLIHGSITFGMTGGGNGQFEIQLHKNGAVLPGGLAYTTCSVDGSAEVGVMLYVESDGTDEFAFTAISKFTVGASYLLANACRFMIHCV